MVVVVVQTGRALASRDVKAGLKVATYVPVQSGSWWGRGNFFYGSLSVADLPFFYLQDRVTRFSTIFFA